MTITSTPTLYEHVGDYIVDIVFSEPIVQTIPGKFTITVVDPCLLDELEWDIIGWEVGTNAFDYTFASDEQTHLFTVTNLVDKWFGVQNTCGTVDLQDFDAAGLGTVTKVVPEVTSPTRESFRIGTDAQVQFQFVLYCYSGYNYRDVSTANLDLTFTNEYQDVITFQ